MNAESTFTPKKILSFATVQEEYLILQRLIKSSDAPEIYVDLSNIEHCDSAGLSLMLEAKRLAQKNQKICTFSSVPEGVWNLALFCGVESMFSGLDSATSTEH